jgi:hypothetical protein
MYITSLLLLMLILPLGAVAVERYFLHSVVSVALLLEKWFVFCGVGMRLLLAGVRQTVNPRYTSEVILGLKTSEPWVVVRELGFANIAIGTVALGSMVTGSWLTPAAVAGCVFYGLAGINHLAHRNRNRLENLAMVSDLLFAGLLLWLLVRR